ncbi:MAG: ribosomal protein S18-alanine N-acetyltransferase [Proteobacteria bacterium]|nr:ribosomal protein S18-alanine N-acetyltransferase [Pseudomonadota bacterium]
MMVGDIPAVVTLEASCVSSWCVGQVESELERKTGLALVACSSFGEVQGWCCGFLVGPDAELLKIAISPQWRRQGIAGALLQELCCQFGERNGERIFLEVRSLNNPALKLYTKRGWVQVGYRKNYYSDPVDDALVLISKLQ